VGLSKEMLYYSEIVRLAHWACDNKGGRACSEGEIRERAGEGKVRTASWEGGLSPKQSPKGVTYCWGYSSLGQSDQRGREDLVSEQEERRRGRGGGEQTFLQSKDFGKNGRVGRRGRVGKVWTGDRCEETGGGSQVNDFLFHWIIGSAVTRTGAGEEVRRND